MGTSWTCSLASQTAFSFILGREDKASRPNIKEEKAIWLARLMDVGKTPI